MHKKRSIRCATCLRTFRGVTARFCPDCRPFSQGVQDFSKVEPDFIPKYTYWSASAIECYESGALCDTCPVGWLQKSSGCKMPQTVKVLVESQGPPKGTLSIRPERFQMKGEG